MRFLLIVTHKNPDIDAIGSIWLLKRFEKGFEEADVKFVNAGDTYQDQEVDSDPNVVHVDTGLGRFDHHQTAERTCAAEKVLDFLKEKYKNLGDQEILERLVEVVKQDDHFEECFWPEPLNDRYSFWLAKILDGLKRAGKAKDEDLVELGTRCLDGIFMSLKLKVEAEEEIEKEGEVFQTSWGDSLAVESKNDEVLKVGQKLGYVLVVRKDPDGMVRIKAQPKSDIDLTKAYNKVKELDPKATWFLHASKRMLLNGSYKNPNHIASKLGLEEIIRVLKD